MRSTRSQRNLALLVAALCSAISQKSQGLERVVQYNDTSCIELKDQNGWSVWASRPGNYCIAQDLYQRSPWSSLRLPHQPVPMGPLIDVLNGGSNITINLMGHHLSTNMHTGLWHSSGGFYKNGAKFPPYHSIIVRNGSIRTTKQVAVFMAHAWNHQNKRFYKKPLGDADRTEADGLANYDGDLSQYRPTEFVLENLTLEADNIAIIMQGMKNVIRHCKIIGGNGTVNLYGPNLTFEDNEIILNAKDPQKDGDEPAVALYLEDAADSVVRNNRITIKGHASKSDAIVLKNSSNVLLEGNTITGTQEVYKLLDERSSVKAERNTAAR